MVLSSLLISQRVASSHSLAGIRTAAIALDPKAFCRLVANGTGRGSRDKFTTANFQSTEEKCGSSIFEVSIGHCQLLSWLSSVTL